MHLVDKILNKSKDYKEVFETEAGKRVLSDLLRFTQYSMHPFTPGDPSMTSWVLGKQVVAKRIIGLLKLSDDDLRSLIKSHGPTEESSEVEIPWGN